MSMPAATWRLTISSTAARTRSASASASTGTPSSLANMIRTRSSGRGRLPVWVVRKRPASAMWASGLARRRAVVADRLGGGIGHHEADRAHGLFLQVREQAGGAREDRDALGGAHRKSDLEQDGRDRAVDVDWQRPAEAFGQHVGHGVEH